MLQMFNLLPMGHYELPMVLSVAAIYCPMGMVHWTMGHSDSSTCVPWVCRINHGTFQMFTSVPWAFSVLHDIFPIGMLKWTMGHLKCSFSIPWATMHCPWSFLEHHDICPMGIFQVFNLFPMGHYALPMVLYPPPPHLSHGHFAVVHGTF
jgi:hypothetical protein